MVILVIIFNLSMLFFGITWLVKNNKNNIYGVEGYKHMNVSAWGFIISIILLVIIVMYLAFM